MPPYFVIILLLSFYSNSISLQTQSQKKMWLFHNSQKNIRKKERRQKKGEKAGKKKESEPLTQHSWKERLGITAC